MTALWIEYANQFPRGQGFTIRGAEAFHRCLICDAVFPQDDGGWVALKQHGFDEHEEIMHYDWRELHGKTVTIAFVEREEADGFRHSYDHPARHYDLIARAEDGTIYFLPEPPSVLYGDPSKGGFKCKPKSRENNLLRLMPSEAMSPSTG